MKKVGLILIVLIQSQASTLFAQSRDFVCRDAYTGTLTLTLDQTDDDRTSFYLEVSPIATADGRNLEKLTVHGETTCWTSPDDLALAACQGSGYGEPITATVISSQGVKEEHEVLYLDFDLAKMTQVNSESLIFAGMAIGHSNWSINTKQLRFDMSNCAFR